MSQFITDLKLVSVSVLFQRVPCFRLLSNCTKLSRFSFFPEPLGEPRARRAGPAARRPHPAQQEEGRQGAHVRRGDIHRVLAAAADVPGALSHRSAGQQVSNK